MIVLVGKTCSGKSTVAHILERKYAIPRVRTYTTRPRRENENTDEYHFVSDLEFQRLKKEDFFLESTYYKVANGEMWWYGTAKEDWVDDYASCIILNLGGLYSAFYKHLKMDVFYLNVNQPVYLERSKARGDDSTEANRRWWADYEDFKHIYQFYDYAITTDKLTPEEVAQRIMRLLLWQR